MTDEEIREFIKMFSDYNLPSPEHHPAIIAYYVKLYKFYKLREAK